jgi:hypothetical protein
MLDTRRTVCCKMAGVKTKDLLAVFGSVHAVRALWSPPLSRSAIYQWGEDVPELRAYQIHEMVPNINQRIRAAKKEKQAA